MFRLSALAVLFFAAGGRSETELGVCPDVTPFADLAVVPYLGTWFEERRAFMIFEGQQDCNQAIYSDLGDGVVEVHNTGRTEAGYYTDIFGTAVVIAPGTLSVTFPGYPSANYTVLGTDYETFSSVVTCNQNGPYRSLYAWVLARQVPLDDASLATALDLFTANGIDVSLFSQTYQGPDCPYMGPNATVV